MWIHSWTCLKAIHHGYMGPRDATSKKQPVWKNHKNPRIKNGWDGYIYIYKWVIKETYNIRNNIYIYIYMILLSIILISDLQRTGCFISQLVQDFVPWTTFLFSQSKWLQKSRSGLGKLMLFPFPVINGALFHGNLRDHPDFINSRPFPWSVRILKFDSRC